MPQLLITENGQTDWLLVRENPVHLAIASSANFDGGTITLEQEINDVAEPVLNAGAAPITYTAGADEALQLISGDRIRLSTAGAGASVNIPVNISGAGLDRA